jgi:hypothetical protein
VGNPTVGNDVAVSPDGLNVYVTTVGGALLNFIREPSTGALKYANCVGIGAGCTGLTGALSVQSVAVSPDSTSVYARGLNGLAVLDRIAATGAIAQKAGFDGCFNEGDVVGCQNADGLAGGGEKLVVSPDGAQVYVPFGVPGGVSIFNRAADGRLSWTPGTCISSDGNTGTAGKRCVDGNNGLATTYVVTISPDRQTVYAGGVAGITAFRRGGDGRLVQVGCYGATAGCTAVPLGITGVRDIAVSLDSGEVVAAASGSSALVAFARDPANGTLTRRPGSRGCITSTGSSAQCLALAQVGTDLMRIVMDPVRPRFYVTSRLGMLATVTRDFAPTCDSFDVSTPMNTALSIPLTCTDRNLDAFTIEKVGAPAAGQIGEIVNNSVFFNPFGEFSGQDSFSYRAVTRARGVDGAPATVKVNVIAPEPTPAPTPVPLPNPSGLDNDRDGFTAGQDCNDDNPAIRPGAAEIRGNSRDENCDGLAEPFPTLGAGVASKWDVKGTSFRLTALQVTQQFP